MGKTSSFILVLVLIVSMISAFASFQKPQTAGASGGLQEDFSGTSLPADWAVHTYHGAYSLVDGHLNLRSTDATDWASVSVQRDFLPDNNGFQLRARVRYNGGYGVYFGLFVSNQVVDLSNIPRAGGVFENTIAISNTYDGFYNGLRHLGSTTFPPFLSAAAVGNWYILELDVSKNPYKVTANVYDDNNILVGSASRTDITLKYSEISVCGIVAYRGVISSDSLANYDVDWIKAENYAIETTMFDDFDDESLNATRWEIVTGGDYSSMRLSGGVVNLVAPPTPKQSWIFLTHRFSPPKGNFTVTTRIKGNNLLLGILGLYTNYDGTLQGVLPDDQHDRGGIILEMWGVGFGFRLARPVNGQWHWSQTSFNPETGKWYVLQLVVEESPFKVTANIYNDDATSLLGSLIATDMDVKYSSINAVGIGAMGGGVASDPISDYDFDWFKVECPRNTGIFQDGFESGSSSEWNGTILGSGETATVTSTRYHHGSNSAMFTSNGGGGYENAYCYRNVTESELYARGYFYVSQSGIDADNDRFFFTVFRANGNKGLAYAGWKRTGGITKWCITMRDGTSYPDVYSSTSPSVGRWYCVELHWKKDSSAGLFEMWVDGSLVCSSSGRNTSAYGDVSVVQIGLAELYGCRATTVYGDCVELAGAYVGPEPKAASSLSMSLLRNPVTPKVGTDITGSLAPERPNSDISVKYRVLGGSESWTTLATVKTNSDSEYSFSWIPAVVASYELKASWAGDAQTLPADSPVARLDSVHVSTQVSISTSSSSTMVGLRVSVAGRLVDQYGDALRNEVVVLHYTFSGISGWVPITSAETNSDGNYSMTWIPTATGYYSLRAEWAGNATHSSATANATLSSISYGNQYVFTVESNSSTSQLAFNETDRSLRFTAAGTDGTRGYARVNVAKNMVNDPSKVKVYVDGAQRSFKMSSVDDSWLLIFDYSHSIHQVTVDLDITIVPEFPGLIVIPLVMMATLLVTMLSRKRRLH